MACTIIWAFADSQLNSDLTKVKIVKTHVIPDINGVTKGSDHVNGGRHQVIVLSNGVRLYCAHIFISSGNLTDGIIGKIADTSILPPDTIRIPVYNYYGGSGKQYFLVIEPSGVIKLQNLMFVAPTSSEGNIKIYTTFSY